MRVDVYTVRGIHVLTMYVLLRIYFWFRCLLLLFARDAYTQYCIYTDEISRINLQKVCMCIIDIRVRGARVQSRDIYSIYVENCNFAAAQVIYLNNSREQK